MSLTAPNVAEVTPNMQNGVMAQLFNAQVLTTFAGMIATATAAFSFTFQGATTHYPLGKPRPISPALKAALQAAGVPAIYS